MVGRTGCFIRRIRLRVTCNSPPPPLSQLLKTTTYSMAGGAPASAASSGTGVVTAGEGFRFIVLATKAPASIP